MKKLAAILCLAAFTTGAFGQGLIKFANSATFPISIGPAASATVMPANSTATYYFALLSAPVGTTDPGQFVFSGLYATNTSAGRLQGGSLLGVTANSTWPAVTTRAFMVAGWSGDNGATWNDAWRTSLPGTGYFGFSSIATGQSGGLDPATQQTLPALALFSGTTISSGFTMAPVPEPTTLALAGLGAAALLIFRRRN